MCDLPAYHQLYKLRGDKGNSNLDYAYSIDWQRQSKQGEVIKFQGIRKGEVHWYPNLLNAEIVSNENKTLISTMTNPFGLKLWEFQGKKQKSQLMFTQVSTKSLRKCESRSSVLIRLTYISQVPFQRQFYLQQWTLH